MLRRRLCPLFLLSSLLLGCGDSDIAFAQTFLGREQKTLGFAQDGGFDSVGAAAGWTVTTYQRGALAQVPPASIADLSLGDAIGAPEAASVLPGPPGSLTPTTVSSGAALRVPLYSGAVAELNRSAKDSGAAQMLTRTVTITPGDFDAFDNKVHLRMGFVPVVTTDASSDATQAPFIYVQVTNQSRGGAVLYQRFIDRTQTTLPWTDDPRAQVSFLPWQSLDVVAGSDHIDVGDQIQVSLVSANSASAETETATLYVDALASTLPLTTAVIYGPSGLMLPGSATYTVRIANESANVVAQADVTVRIPSEWQVSSIREPSNAVCDTAVSQGNQMLVHCLVSNLGAGSTRSLGLVASAASSLLGPSTFDSTVSVAGTLPVMGPPLITSGSTTLAYADLSAALAELQVDPCTGVVTYGATFVNNGPTAVGSTQVGMLLPVSVEPLSWECVASTSAQCAGGSSASGTGRLNLGAALDASGEIRCTVRVAVAREALGNIFPAAFAKALDATSESFPYNNSSAARLSPQSWPICTTSTVVPATVSGPTKGGSGDHTATNCFRDEDCAAGFFCNPLYYCEAPTDPNASPWILEGAGGPAAGCQAGTGSLSSIVPWLMLLGLTARRLWRQRALTLSMCMVLSFAAPAQAAEESLSFPTDHFRLYAGSHDIYSVQGARTPQHSGVSLTMFGSYADRLLRVVAQDRSTEQFILRSQTTLDTGVSIASDRGYELGIVLPLTWQATDRAAYFATALARAPDTFGIGDILVAPKVAVWHAPFAALSLAAPLTLPTGKARSFLGYAGPTITPSLLASLGQDRSVQLLANAGYAFRPHRAIGTIDLKDAFVWGVGGVVPVDFKGVRAEAKLSVNGELGVGKGRQSANPTELHGGLRYTPDPILSIDVGAGTGLNNSVGMPRWRVFAGVVMRSPVPRHDGEHALAPALLPPALEAPPNPPTTERLLAPTVQVLPLEPEAAPEPPEAPARPLEPVLFDLERSRLRADAAPMLEKARLWVASLPPGSLCRIEGHADSHGSGGLNKRLTQARAEAIKAWLVAHGIPANRLRARGCGTDYPVADNLTEAGRAQNRRGVFRQVSSAEENVSK